jgi:tetratricopeptide (TPR) repeat protein
VTSSQRPGAKGIALLALSLASTPLLAQGSRQPEQRGGVPNGDTPHILVAPFHSPDRVLGVAVADEVRKRLQDEHSTKELYVIPRINIVNTLEASGYRADSALNTSELWELARTLRGDEVLDGSVSRSARGVRVEPRLLMKSGQQTLTQPLPALDARDPGDAAKQVERALTEASKAIPAYKLCTTALFAGKYDEAAKAARSGLTVYANSNFARICLMSVFVSQKAPPDSIISIAKAIIATDSTSVMALANLADAQLQKGDTARAIDANLAIFGLDPTNTTIGVLVVRQLVSVGSPPDVVLPVIESILGQIPDHPEMLRTKWLVQLKARRFKEAIATGQAYVKADTAAATLDYYQRQIGAAQQLGDATMVQQLAVTASEKFPGDADLQVVLAQGYRKAGQLQSALVAARRAAQIDQKNTRTTTLVMYIQNDLNQPDSAIATAQKAIASGQSKDTIGQVLLANVGPAIDRAQKSTARADWEAALKAAHTVDALAPSPHSKFYTGVAAYNVATDALTNVQALQQKGGKEDRAKACEELKVVEDDFAIASIAMPPGGVVDKAAAAQILGYINTYGAYVPQFKKALRCK